MGSNASHAKLWLDSRTPGERYYSSRQYSIAVSLFTNICEYGDGKWLDLVLIFGCQICICAIKIAF